MKKLDRDLFNRLFARKHSYYEQKLIQHGFEDLEKTRAIKEIAKHEWNTIIEQTESSPVDLSNSFYKLYHVITESQKLHVRLRLIKSFSRVAAALLIPLLLISVYFYSENRQIKDSQLVKMTFSSPEGIRSQFMLPDGSSGWLNGGSKLEYISNNYNTRSVKLEGEAFFDVAKDARRPFILDAGIFDVKVYGTRFNVYSYPDEDWADLVLESGKVTVSDKSKDVQLKVVPGQRFIINNNTKKYHLGEVNVAEYIEWTDGKLYFRNDPMSLVVKKLSRFYNVEIEIEDENIYDYNFRAILQDESLEEVVRYLELTFPIQATIIPSAKKEDGSFSKQKIIIKNI